LRFRTRGFQKVANASIELAEAATEGEVCALIVRTLKDLTEAAAATFGIYDPALKSIVVKRAESESDIGSELVEALGGTALTGCSYPLSETTWQEILANPIGYRITLGEAAFGVPPEPLRQAARKLAGSYRFLGIAYWLQGQLYGTSLVALRADTPDPTRDLLRLFAQMAAANVRRVRVESALRGSEARFKSVFESANVSKSITLPTGEITVNRAFCDLLGYSQEELRDQKWQDLTPAEDADLTQDAIDQLLKGNRETVRFTERFRHKDGSLVWADVSSAVQRDGEGKPLYMVTTIVDITKRRRAEEALIESESRYRSLIMNSPDAILVAEDGHVVFVNSACCRLFGANGEGDLIGRTSLSLIHPDFHEQILAGIRRIRATGEAAPLAEAKVLRIDGEAVDTDFVASPFRFEGRFALHIILRDITEQRRMEERLRQSQKMETVGQLAGGVAHDFNNMLQVISSYADMSLARIDAGDPLHKYLREIRKAAQRSADMTAQLLTFARKQTVSPQIFDLNEAVARSRRMLQRLIGETIDLVLVPGETPVLVKVDPAQLDQVLVNLAMNARDAITGVGHLRIETGRAVLDEADAASRGDILPGKYAVFSVSDNGCGMDEETKSHLFEPFFTTKDQGKGTGLGLATIYGIVKQNNGFITVDTALGKGTTFRIRLPEALDRPRAG
jgi:PAS domain S-box-containing protein